MKGENESDESGHDDDRGNGEIDEDEGTDMMDDYP